MATSPILPFVSVEEYMKTDYEPHCEYLDGVLAPKALPDYIHSTFQMLLVMFFRLQKNKFQASARFARAAQSHQPDAVSHPGYRWNHLYSE